MSRAGNADGVALARAAAALIGAPFRLHGRDPATGVDCVGLIAAALAAIGRDAEAPSTYGPRNRDIGPALHFAAKAGFVDASGPLLPGDLLLVQPGPLQHHLLILGESGAAIHAHAGLRRVVSTPAPIAGPILRHWRIAPSN